MALPKRAQVTFVEELNPLIRRVICEMADPETLDFIGGQYIIVNSGRLLPNGKMGKRAYSIPTSDSSARQFELVVRRIPDGVGSDFIHSLKPGDSFEFSGPWGKYLPPASEESFGNILVIATDTGLSAALGLVNGSKFRQWLPQTRLLWFVESERYFVLPQFAADRMPQGIRWQIVNAPQVGDDSRVSFCRREIESLLKDEMFGRIYLSGDGKVLSSLEDLFLADGYRSDQIVTETFFNHKELKTASIS